MRSWPRRRRTGDMKISTPTATVGIRASVWSRCREGASATRPNNVAIKLYPERTARSGGSRSMTAPACRLGFLTQGASGFTIRPGRRALRRVPLTIRPQQALRDQGLCGRSIQHKLSPPSRDPATRLASRQSRAEQSEPRQPTAPAGPQRRMVCRNGQARSSGIAKSPGQHHRTFRIGRGCSSGRVRRPNPVRQDNRIAEQAGRSATARRAAPNLQQPGCSGPLANRPALQQRRPPCQRQKENPKGKALGILCVPSFETRAKARSSG